MVPLLLKERGYYIVRIPGVPDGEVEEMVSFYSWIL